MSRRLLRQGYLPQLTTLPKNGQHLAVPIATQARNSRGTPMSEGGSSSQGPTGHERKETGMRERVIC
jgi:hypothetical protein